MSATDLFRIILLFTLAVTRGGQRATTPSLLSACRCSQLQAVPSSPLPFVADGEAAGGPWHPALVPPGRIRQRRNPARNRARWQRRYRRWQRQHPPVSPRRRRPRQQAVLRQLLGSPPPSGSTRPTQAAPRLTARPATPPVTRPTAPTPAAPDPLAHLRQGRGWIDRLPEAELWDLLRQVRWAGGLQCPHCGETAPTCLSIIDRHYRGGLYRYRCLVCDLAGDEGEGGTFTDLTGTLFDGCRLDIRSLWLIIELFVDQAAAVETADEVGINRHSVDRYFRLLRGAIYQARRREPIALGPEDIVEGDEVYLTAGLKGRAGGQDLGRAPRRRGLKRRGRGTWDSDRLPVFGLICRGGQLRLCVLRNVQTVTIRPIVEEMVRQGAKVYTDSYDIYHFLGREGYQHATVNHSAGEYARGEVHCNTIECTWSWLRQMIRTYRGVSKVYLPLYVAQFEFFYNRRHDSRWSRMLDVLMVAFQADPEALLASVESAAFAQICPVAG